LKANYADKKWQGVDIKRKSFITSIEKMSKALHLSHQNIRTALKHLEKTGEINKQSNKHHTIVTVCNYDNYQYDISKANNQLTNSQQTPNKRLTTTKNNKKEKNEKNNTFDEFWIAYSSITGKHKTDKEPTKKYWVNLTDVEKKNALQNIKPYFDSLNDKKYCKKARTYLKDKNFNDEFTAKTGTASVDDIIASRQKKYEEMKNESN